MERSYDLIVIGTGFASSFFLLEYLKRAPQSARIAVLERGGRDTHAWQIRNRKNSSIEGHRTFINPSREKAWITTIGFGGGSNCWWAMTPRHMPNDFRLKSMYGIGSDWPLSYDELEPYYMRAEEIMSIAGPEHTPFPRSGPYPQPPHLLSDPDKVLQAAFPDTFIAAPTARARRSTDRRSMCCATGVCNLCPVNAKFSIQNELNDIYDDPRVEVRLNAEVMAIETAAGIAGGVRYVKDDVESAIQGDLIVLGANALFNPAILQRSEMQHPALGRGLCEQISVSVTIDLDGLDNYQGSTSLTGHGFMFYDGEHRKNHAACLVETSNIPAVRLVENKWRQRLDVKFIFEDLPSADNYVHLEQGKTKPTTEYKNFSDYTSRGIAALPEMLQRFLAPLPVEKYIVAERPNSTESHIMGTTVMGNDPATSVVDRFLIHHRYRNLLVLGSGAFPTCSPANPTLTISALSLRTAEHILG